MEDILEGFGENFLILDRVEMLPRWRGRGLGRWFAAEAIEVLSDGGPFVAIYASPMDESEGTARRRAESKLKGVWGDIGFEESLRSVLSIRCAARRRWADSTRSSSMRSSKRTRTRAESVKFMATPDKSVQSPVHAAKQEITETIKFLDWLWQTHSRHLHPAGRRHLAHDRTDHQKSHPDLLRRREKDRHEPARRNRALRR